VSDLSVVLHETPARAEALVHSGLVDIAEQTRDELLLRLAEQRRFLTVSCAAFDAGDHAEAKRIAASLRVLLHDRGSSRALLAQLDTRDQIGWLDTAGSILPLVAGAQTPLVFISVEERAHQSGSVWLPTRDAWDRRLQERPHLPPEVEETLARMRAAGSLRSRGRWLPFEEWWDADVLRDMGGRNFTRGELVTVLASTDGGAPDDPRLDEVYDRLSRRNSTGWAIKLERGPTVPLLGPALASVRQVAYEVERSLLRGAPST
jgi:hypothetical protein